MGEPPENWQCPFCGHHTTLTEKHYTHAPTRARVDNRHGNQAVIVEYMACANAKCRELSIRASLCEYIVRSGNPVFDSSPTKTWLLVPESSAKPIPGYVPKAIRSDYQEACLILHLSPKASATLARRALQGMIRDFWQIAKGTLNEEIKALETQVTSDEWAAIDAVRQLGNIGAHMGKDVNLIVDVDPKEAQLLILLVEDLIHDWYVQRAEREKRRKALVAAATSKKSVPPTSAPPTTP